MSLLSAVIIALFVMALVNILNGNHPWELEPKKRIEDWD